MSIFFLFQPRDGTQTTWSVKGGEGVGPCKPRQTTIGEGGGVHVVCFGRFLAETVVTPGT